MNPIAAVYSQGEIIVPTQSDADSLLQDGFGFRDANNHYLNPVEVLFNVERGKISVIDEASNRSLPFNKLLELLSEGKEGLWTEFIVYKDLRTRGFIIKIEEDRLLVYERGTFSKGPPSYITHILSEGKPQDLSMFITNLAAATDNGYEVKVAVVDRRGELVYYSVSETELTKE